jgi:hypothetical protein
MRIWRDHRHDAGVALATSCPEYMRRRRSC